MERTVNLEGKIVVNAVVQRQDKSNVNVMRRLQVIIKTALTNVKSAYFVCIHRTCSFVKHVALNLHLHLNPSPLLFPANVTVKKVEVGSVVVKLSLKRRRRKRKN